MIDVDSPLYRLLPQLYRLRDTEHDQKLAKLLYVLAANHAELERGLTTLYDDWFIETCAPEVVPSLGALVGARDLSGSDLDRAMVADAATMSGAKGTLTALETLTADLVGWPARVLEAAASLAVLASARFPDVLPRQLPDLRRVESGQAGRARRTSRLPDVRDVGSPRTRGRGKMTSVLVLLWRLRPDTAVDAAASRRGDRRFTFDPFGAPIQLAVRPVARQAGAELVADLDVPAPIGRTALAHHLVDYYGPGRSIEISVDGRAVPIDDIVVGDLTYWRHRPRHRRRGRYERRPDRDPYERESDPYEQRERESNPSERREPDRDAYARREYDSDDDERHEQHERRHRREVCIDPVLGRISLGPHEDPDAAVRVTYSRLVTGDVGSGHDWAGRPVSTPARLRVRADATAKDPGLYPSVAAALAAWCAERDAGGGSPTVTIEVLDDTAYEDGLRIDLFAGEELRIVATPQHQPVLAPFDERGEPHRVHVHGHAESRPGTGPSKSAEGPLDPARVWLGGLRIRGGVHVAGPLSTVTLERCTLDPGGRRDRDSPESSLRLDGAVQQLVLTGCISGPLRIGAEPDRSHRPQLEPEPVRIAVSDSVLDGGEPADPVVFGPRRRPAIAVLDLARCTLFGSVTTRAVGLVQDCIITGQLDCARRQHGEVIFTSLGRSPRAPQQQRCQPQLALAENAESGATTSVAAVSSRVEPVFDSREFGRPAYARLALDAPTEITAGAHDGGELGAFHDQWAAARTALLRRRLADFVPTGIDVDIRFAT